MGKVEFLSPVSSVSMADEWFEFARADHFWMQWRHEILLRELKRTGDTFRNALEIGCGHGVVRELVERDLKFPVDGCDLNQHALEMAKNGSGRLFVYNIFDRNSAMLRAYDLVLLMDVIEHLDDDVAFLQASLDHLKPGGIVVINVPAHMVFYSQYDEVAGHKRRYGGEQLRTLFQKTGVETMSVVSWGFSLVPALIARKFVLHFVSRENTIRTGFAEHNALTRGFFRFLKRAETSLPLRIPVGTSLLAVGRLKS
jgi:SAM-dependent methyltransferase